MAMSKSERHALELLRKRLTWDRASFVAFDKEKDAEVKKATRLYVDSWLIPAISLLLGDDPDKPGAERHAVSRKADVGLAIRLLGGY